MKLADSIAYLNHDFQDALRAGLLEPADLPLKVARTLGTDHSTRLRTLVRDCTFASWDAAMASPEAEARIELSPAVLAATDVFRDFMFERVYLAESTLEGAREGQAIVRALYRHFEAHAASIPGWSLPDDPPWRRAADYVSGMTDGFATRVARDLGLLVRA